MFLAVVGPMHSSWLTTNCWWLPGVAIAVAVAVAVAGGGGPAGQAEQQAKWADAELRETQTFQAILGCGALGVDMGMFNQIHGQCNGGNVLKLLNQKPIVDDMLEFSGFWHGILRGREHRGTKVAQAQMNSYKCFDVC